ncbi:putative alpha/beta hydrolase [Mycolicibacterium mengxianglii]|uniref:putative alpha/beta hydrolase n=1 Tax=Mycolicibacterium mengxianglii TaxID=2736649 RepID=UPI0018D0220D|nr:hypothetical protein [Mycolicibacterium mengxianglii]
MTKLFLQKDKLPLIAVDLQNFAAGLVEAESRSSSNVDDLDCKVILLDILVGKATAGDEKVPPVPTLAARSVGTMAASWRPHSIITRRAPGGEW